MNNPDNHAARKGLYLLLLVAREEITLRLGTRSLVLRPGAYTYIGSACGPGGLSARVARHLCGQRRRIHWHIDRLIEAGLEPVLAVTIPSEKLCRERAEPLLALATSATRATTPVPGKIGSTDDKLAETHLYRLNSKDPQRTLETIASSMPSTPQTITRKQLCKTTH